MKLFLLVFLLVASAMAQVPAVPTPPVYFSGSAGPGGKFPFFNNGSITMADADYTMVVPDFTASVIAVQGTLTASRTLYAPATRFGFEYTIINATAGNFPIVVKPEGNPAATGVTVPSGQAMMVIYNGVNYVSVGGGGGGTGLLVGNTGIKVDTTTTPGMTTLTGNIINAVTDCGLKGDGVTDDSAALQACIDNHAGRTIFLPKRTAGAAAAARPHIDYWMGATTIHLRGTGTELQGEGAGQKWLGGTALFWTYNTRGLQVDGYYDDYTAGCLGCRVKDLYLSGPDNMNTHMPGYTVSQCYSSTDSSLGGYFGTAHGLVIDAGETDISDVNVQCFNGNGVFIRGNQSVTIAGAVHPNQPDLWSLKNVTAMGNNGNGLMVEGGDSNAGHEESGNFFGNQLWGIWENSLLANAYVSNHTNSNGRTFYNGGMNKRTGSAISRVSNVVTLCFTASTTIGSTTNAAGFAVGNKLTVNVASQPTAAVNPQILSTGASVVTVTAVSPTATTACPITGSGSTLGGWVQYNQTGSDLTVATAANVDVGIASDITSLSRTANVVSISATAASTTLTPSDIDKVGRWVKIANTGTELDGHVFRPTAVTPGAGSSVTLSFNYLGPDITTINTGNIWSADSRDMLDPSQTIRTVFDASMPAGVPVGSPYNLNSESAQFPIDIGVSGPNKTGQQVRVAGAGPGGTVLITTANRSDNASTAIGLAANASQAVTNVEADFGGSWSGGAYQSTTRAAQSVWINTYYEANQRVTPLRFSPNTIVLGGNLPTNNNQSDPAPATQLDATLGMPTMMQGNVLIASAGMNFQARTDSAPTWYYTAGLSKVTDQKAVVNGYNGIKRFELWHDYGAGGIGVSLLDGQLIASPSTIDLRFNNYNQPSTSAYPPPASGRQLIRIGYNSSNPSDFGVYGYCSDTGVFQSSAALGVAYDTGYVTYLPPCRPTAAHPFYGTQMTMWAYGWDTTAGAITTGRGWNIHPLLAYDTTTTSQLNKSTMRIEPTTQGVTPLPLFTLSAPTVSMDSYTFANLTAWKSFAPATTLAAGTQAFCNNCVVVTPASCSITSPASCKCAQGTGSVIAKYENFANGGLDWYCAEPGASTSGTASGNVSSTGAAGKVHQVAVWASDTTIDGISPLGTAGQVLTSNGPGANPSWQPSAGGPSASGPTFPVTRLTTTSTTPVTAQDFQNCTTFVSTNNNGTPTIQLPTPAPPNGQCIWFVNYATTQPAISRAGTETINGQTAIIYVPPATGPTTASAWKIISDGTNYIGLKSFSGAFNGLTSGVIGSGQIFTIGATAGMIAPSTNTGNNGTINGTRFNSTTNTLNVVGNNTGTAGTTANVIASGTITADVGMVAPQFTVNPNPPVPASATLPQTRGPTSRDLSQHTAAFRVISPGSTNYLDIDVPDSGNPTISSSTGTVNVQGVGGGAGGPVSLSDLTDPTALKSFTMRNWRLQYNFDFTAGGSNRYGVSVTETTAQNIPGFPSYLLSAANAGTASNTWPLNMQAGNTFVNYKADGTFNATNGARFVGPLRLTDTSVTPVPVANAAALGTDANGNVIPVSGGAGPLTLIYSTPIINLALAAPTATFFTTTMVTPTSNTNYRFEFQIKQTNSATCTTFPNYLIRLGFTDVDTNMAVTMIAGGLSSLNFGGTASNVNFITAVATPTVSQVIYGVPVNFYAASGQPVQLLLYQNNTAACTVFPTITVRPFLYQVNVP